MTAEPTVRDGSLADARSRRRLLVTIISSVVVFSASMTIVSASLPTMADDLHSTEAVLSWAITGLFLMMAVGTPILGRLGDLHGHRRVFLAGAAVLAVGTILCGLAPSALAFVGARMIVGVGIAATLPNAMALILEAYPPHERPKAMGWFQMAMTGAPVAGLILGGPLIEAFGWRAVFAVLSPIAVLGVIAAWRVIRPSERVEPFPLDWAGAACLAVGTLGLLLFLQVGGSSGFADPRALALIVVAALAIVAFVQIEQRASHPLLRLDYLRRPNFTGPLIAQPLAQFAYMGSFLIAPILLDDLFGFSVSAIALVLLFRPLAFSVSSPIGGRLAMVAGERTMMTTGSLLLAAGMGAWVVGALWANLTLVILGLVCSGLAMGLATPSYSTVIAAAVDPGDLGVASGMSTTMMNIGVIAGIQTMFTVLGDGRQPEDFARVFAVGAVAAALGLIGARMVRSTPGGARVAAPAVVTRAELA